MYICPYCQGTGATINMVPGFPGYFISSPCYNGCQQQVNFCLTCLSVGKTVCIEHSEVPFNRSLGNPNKVAIHREPIKEREDHKNSISSICGDIIEYLKSIKGIRLDP